MTRGFVATLRTSMAAGTVGPAIFGGIAGTTGGAVAGRIRDTGIRRKLRHECLNLVDVLSLHLLDLLDELRNDVLLIPDGVSYLSSGRRTDRRSRSRGNRIVLLKDILDAKHDLVDKVSLVLLAFGFFKGEIGGFSELLMGLTKKDLECVPGFLVGGTAIPLANGFLEATSAKEDQVGLIDGLEWRERSCSKLGVVGQVINSIEDDIDGELDGVRELVHFGGFVCEHLRSHTTKGSREILKDIVERNRDGIGLAVA